MQLLLTGVRLLGRPDLVSVWCDGGLIAGVSAEPAHVPRAPFERTIDVAGRLLLPAFVNPHLHPDKSLVGDRLTFPGATVDEAVRLTWDFKSGRTEDEIADRATEALLECLAAGSTVVRAFADVDRIGGLRPVRALIKVRERLRGLVDVQVVAFPQEGLLRPEGDIALLRDAMREGADVVGGLPWYEHGDENARRHVDLVVELAVELDRDVHFLADDTDDPTSRTLEYLALRTIETGWQGRVTASHCGALSAYDHAHAGRVIALVKEAGVSICSNPHISLVLDGLNDRGLIRRGITRVTELLDAGVNVCSGQDDIDDPYYPFGRGDQLEVASFVSHVARLTKPEEIELCLRMVTVNAAKALRLSNYGVEAGCRADLVVLDGRTPREAMRLQSPRPFVIKAGNVVAENRVERLLVRAPGGELQEVEGATLTVIQ
jgi:cytosine/creatinine deaminase